MASQKQQQEEMVNTFVASIPTMQTDIALLKQEVSTVRKNGEAVLKRLDELSVVSSAEFESYRTEEKKWKEEFLESLEERLKPTEKFIEDNKSGIKFANALVSRWTTFLVLLILTAAVIVIVGRFIPVGGAGV